MGKVGLLAALQGTDNWDAIREGRQRELQLSILQDQNAKQALQEQQQAAALAQDYLSTVGKIKVLDPAIEGIQNLNDKLTEKIREGILKAGGDVKKYIAEGGAIDLKKYKEGLLNSPEVAKGIMSAANYNRFVADSQLGLVPRGNPQEDLKSYMDKGTDVFPYQGAYQQPDLTNAREYFGKARGKNKYQQQPVDAETLRQYVITEAKKQGLNQIDADHYADKTLADYKTMIKGGGQPYMFGADTWTPSKAWEDQHAAEMSVKYIVDGFKAVTDPSNTDVWAAPVAGPTTGGYTVPGMGITIPTPMHPFVAGKSFQTADVLPGLDLGDKTVHVAKGRQVLDKDGSPVTLGSDAYIQVKDRLLPFIKKDDKVYMQTLAQQMAGEEPQELSDGSIDKLFTGITRTPKILNIISALRKELKNNKNLTPAGRPDFDKGKKKIVGF